MAVGTSPPSVESAAPGQPGRRSAQLVEYDQYIDEQIRKTRSFVKSVDIALGVLALVVAVLGFILAAVVLDHWIVPGGLGFWGRLACFALLVGGVVYLLVRRVAPLVMHSINPLYAANAIEQSRSSFKNSLLNLLLFRQDRAAVPEAVYRSVERQAATVLAEAPIETAVDRSGLIRWGYVLAALVAALGLYKAISPKDPLVTLERIVAPWADVAAPTRVMIRDVQPGNGTYVAGRRVEVTAEIDGLDGDEPAWLYFSTTDGQIADQALRMSASSGYRYRVAVPPDGVDLRQDITYRIEAGDAKTPTYALAVEDAPMIVVKAVDYNYPAYTEGVLQDRRDERSGDIKALEGTQVTIHAQANQDIASAHIDFGCDGTKDLPMAVKGREASRAFELKFAERAARVAQHTRYQVLFTTRQQRPNEQPVQHTIEVVPDLSPEVEVVRPDKEEVLVPENGQETISVKALDPDFKLDDVRLAMEVEGAKALPPQSLLAEKDRPWQGWLAANYRFVPRQHGLKAGSVVTFHAAARDNRAPEANLSRTRDYRIRIVAPQTPEKRPDHQPTPADPNEKQPDEKQKPNDKPDPQNDKQGESPEEKKQSDNKQDKSNQGGKGQEGDQQDPKGGDGEQGDSKQQSQKKKPGGGKSDANNDPTDGDKQDGQSQPGEKENAGNAKDQHEGEKSNGGADGNQKKQDRADTKGGDNKGGDNKGNDTGEPQGDGTAGGQKSAQRGNPAGERKADDSDAIDELLKDRQKSAGEKESSDKSKPDGEGDSTENKTTQPGESTDEQSVRKPKPETGDAQRSPSPTDDAAPKDQGAEKSPDGDSNKTDRTSDAEGLGKKSEKGQPGKTDSGGAKPKADLESNDKTQQKSSEKSTEQKPGLGDPGRSNAGQAAGKDPDGAPEAQEKNKPRRQNPREGEQGGKGKEDEAKSPSQSENQTNNSKGKNQGDRSGGGKQGGGEGSKQAGQDKPGSQQSSDKGANASEDKGDGETGSKSGDGEKADGKTGQSGNDKGPGSKTKSGEKSGGDGQSKKGEKRATEAKKTDKSKKKGNETTGKSGEKSSDNRQDGQESDGQGGDAPGAGDAPRTNDKSTPRENDPPEAPREDEPNLDHARRATDLALDHLRDRMQKGQDQEILKKLGWSRDEADEFLRRWADLKRKANQSGADGADGRRQLDDALKSLGLRPGRAVTQTTTAEKDSTHGLTSGPRVPAPPEYADRAKAYKRGIGESEGAKR
jgi:hypothetical protein